MYPAVLLMASSLRRTLVRFTLLSTVDCISTSTRHGVAFIFALRNKGMAVEECDATKAK